ncbi:MAG TPA: hypothetical protein VFK33_10220 [Bacillales bacterium]|nr:hypothetical protein [Bacillales bacterium]
MAEYNAEPNRRKTESRSLRHRTNESGIEQVDLSKYQFSPPGPMGWTEKEYQKLIDSLKNERER